MKYNYVSVYLTFLLSCQTCKNEPILVEPFLSKVPVCITEECRRTAEMLREAIDYGTPPCKDFYRFACGRFFNGNLPMQAARRIFNINDKIIGFLNSDNDHNIQAIAKIQKIFRLCLDEDKIKKFGDKVIQLQLNNVGLHSMPPFHTQTNIPNNFSRILAKLHRNTGIPFLFSVDVKKDPKDFRKNRFFIQLDSFTIQYIDALLLHYEVNRQKRDELFKKYMMGVVRYMYQIEEMNISGEILEFVSGRIHEVVQFLLNADEVIQEYFYSLPNYEYITVQKLQEKTDKILRNTNIKFNWQEYLLQLFENMFGNDVEVYFGSGEPLIVNKMKYIENIFEVISTINADVFKASLWWVSVNDVTAIAYKKLRKLYDKFNEKTFGFKWSRQHICFAFVRDKYSHALTHLLLQEVNTGKAKYEVYVINENLKNIFIETIENASWMDELTREEAKRKLNNMRTFISHESWVEKSQKIENKYAGVTVEYSWFETRLKENIRRVEENLKILFVKNAKNKRLFPMDVLSITYRYSHTENIADIPFGILGMPFINYGLDCMNYGGIGVALGSLLTMPFDEAGRKIDSCGNERNWWEESTLQEFNNRAKCFADFYSKFNFNGREIEMDGNRTLDSNIADNVGMKLVLSAYEKYVNDYNTEPKLIGFEGYSSEQLLTLAMANTMCISLPQDDYYKKYQKDIHSIPHLTVNGIFMNSKKMSDIWGCPEESRMNPKDKCYIF